jgi:toxin ParE1/3/4
MPYHVSRRARRDLLSIWTHIAVDSESAADRFVDLLSHHFGVLSEFPEAGRRRDEVRPGYRSFPVGEYLIFYRIGKPGMRIMHIVHGMRDLRRYRFGS